MTSEGAKLAPVPTEHGSDPESTELALWMGQLLMDHGAESERVEQGITACGVAFDCHWSAVLVTYDALFVAEHGEPTEVRRARPRVVDMHMIEELSHLRHRILEGVLSRLELRDALAKIETAPRHYSAQVTGLAIALACAAFSRLFQGDWGAFAVTFIGSGAAMFLRHFHARRKPNRLIFVGASAFAAALIVGLLQRLTNISHTPQAAYAACALMVVPGVPAINAVQDLFRGYIGVALARIAETILVILAGTLGIVLGLALIGAEL